MAVFMGANLAYLMEIRQSICAGVVALSRVS
jgi:hypothetical protein